MPFDGSDVDLTGTAEFVGTFGAASYDASQIGQAIQFENGPDSSPSTGQYVGIADQSEFEFGPGQDFSVSLWVNTTDYVNGDNRSDPPLISNKDWDSFNNRGWIIAGGTGAGAGGWQWNFDTSQASSVSFRPPATESRIDDGQWHHIAVVHDRDGEASFYHDGNPIGSVNIATHNSGTVSAGLPLAIATDGRFGQDWDAYFNGAFDDVAIWERALSAEEVGRIQFGGTAGLNVQQINDFELASIEVNTTSGMIELASGTVPSQINSYEIRSPAGSLNVDGWLAGNLSAQGLDAIDGGDDPGERWEVITADSTQLFEAFLLGSSDFSDGRTESLGSAYNLAEDARDLTFTYTLVTGQEIVGDVFYVGDVGNFAESDFDENGVVDGEDFLAWQLGFGTMAGATKMEGDADGDGDVDGGDFLVWQLQFQGQAGAAASAVPEAGSLGLLLLVTAAAVGNRRRSANWG